MQSTNNTKLLLTNAKASSKVEIYAVYEAARR